MDRNTETTCALDGCPTPIVRRAGGGRPRLYCSDAHRAEARRRRLGGLGTPEDGGGVRGGGGDDPIDQVRRLLDLAGAALGRIAAPAPGDDALVAAVRAEATAGVLAAQQQAADATRQAAAAHDQLERERAEWQATLRELADERATQRATIEELGGALDGARAELERELVSHHHDVQQLDGRLNAEAAAHLGALAGIEHELDEARRELAVRIASTEHADRRADAAAAALERQAALAVELEVRAARAEEQSRQATRHVAQLQADVTQARQTLAEERRHHRSIVAELRRQVRGAGAPRSRQAPGRGPTPGTVRPASTGPRA